VQRRKEREFCTGEESKNETSAIKREKRVLDRGRKQERDKTSAIKERKEIFGQGKRAKTRQVQAQGEDYFNSQNIPIL
jgi:hypothetical protein